MESTYVACPRQMCMGNSLCFGDPTEIQKQVSRQNSQKKKKKKKEKRKEYEGM